MKTMFVPAYIINFAIIAVLGCAKEVRLTPDTIDSDDYSSYSSANLMNGNLGSFWMGKYFSEDVIYHFSNPILHVHNYG